jgi:hypothetical protein
MLERMAKHVSKKKIVLGLFLLIIATVVALIFFVIVPGLSKPVSGTITTKTVRSDIVSIDLTPVPKVSKYISYDYPKGMTPQPQVVVASPYLQEDSYHAADTQTWVLGVTVSTPPGGVVSGDSGFKLRQSNPAVYTQSSETLNGQKVIIMTDTTQNFGKVAYIMHGGQLATISLYGSDNAGPAPLQSAFNQTLSSLHWQ